MGSIFVAIVYQPIFNLLVALYNVIPGSDIGLAIIALTIIVRLLLWPLSAKALRSQKALSILQPKVEALKKEYAGKSQEELGRALMALYSKEKVSPVSSCLPLVLQRIVLIPLYQAMANGLKSSGFNLLYPFIVNPGTIDPKFLGLVDLAAPSIPFAILCGVTQFFQAKMMSTKPQPHVSGSKDEEMLAKMNKQMLYLMPALMVFIGWKLPGGLTLYIIVTNLISILQQWLTLRKRRNGTPPTTPAVAAPAV